MPTFNHLHCHTQFSLLDGAADITKMLTKAKNDGMRGCAITDHGNMFGVFKFVAEATKIGVKPIVGCEFYLVEDRHKRQFTKGEKDKRFHQLFLAKNEEGYRNLVKLCSLGFIEGMYGKYPRIDKSLILKYHKGLIATTCCLGAEVPQTILKKGEAEGEKVFQWWLDLFGEDYYVELQNHEIPDQIKANEVLKKFAKKYGVKMIASNDSHYVEREDSNAHDILLCINTGEKQSTPTMKEISDDDDPSAFKGKRFAFYNDEFYFKTTAEMVQLFQDIPEAIDNTNEIVDKCDHLKLKKDILLPNYPIPSAFSDQDAYLRHITMEGARKRYKELTPEVEERINFELNTIRTMGFAGYFLIVQDYINAGRELGVFVGPGRGCLTGDMKVVMENGTTKDLAKVEVGDKVITHDGSVKSVTNRFEYDVNEDLLKIHAHYGDFVGINLTKDHKVLAEKVNTGSNRKNKTPLNLNARPQGNLTWHKASELTKDDWLFIPIIKSDKPALKSIDIATLVGDLEVEVTDTHVLYQNELGVKEKITRIIPLEKDWMRLVGMLTAADWKWDDAKKELQLVVRKDTELLSLFHKRMNALGWSYSETSYSQYSGQGHERTRTLQMNVPSRIFHCLMKFLFPRYQHSIETKHVPDFVTYSERDQLLAYLNGFMSVAGSKKRTAQAIGTHSRELADQLRFLYWQLKAPVNMVVQEIKRAFTKRLRYTLTIPNESRINPLRIDAFTHSRPLKNAQYDGIMVQVKSVSNLKHIKKVYDIEVEDNHDYLTTSFQVHNSAAGSAVAYCIGITNIDPIKYDLLFERFLNPDRKSMPDIDTDFDDEGRQKVIDYVVDKYGKNQVAQIITYGSMAAKMSIKDVARVLDLPLSEANALAKLVPEKPGISLNRVMLAPIDGEKSLTEKEGLDAEAIEGCKKLREIYSHKDTEQSRVLASALKLEGSVRNTGIHAAGIIIAPQDLTDLIPVSTAKDADLLVTQFEGKVIEDAGVIKMDFLGLKNLTILRDALKLIKQNHGVEIDIDSIPLDDKKTFELYQKAKTNGTFQFESTGMQKYLKDLKPDKFEDLIAMNALYRPGPLAYIPNYINRKHGREPIIYDLPEMEEYLKDTYGINVYQEQIMLLSQKLAGFTKGDADVLRKAMGKKDRATLDKMKGKFMEGCEKKGLALKTCDKVWTDWEAFASYAFNKSHSTCYAFVAFQTAYLKAHYTAEYMAAVLTHNANDIKKITFFIDECKSLGIEVLPCDINESEVLFSVNKKGQIRFGVGALKGVGEDIMHKILEERTTNGIFKSLFDMLKRLPARTLNKRILESLIHAGAMDCFGIERYRYFLPVSMKDETNLLEKSLAWGTKMQQDKNSSQGSLFGGGGEEEPMEIEPTIPPANPEKAWTRLDELNYEKLVTGFYLTGHPLDKFKWQIDAFPNHLFPLDVFDDKEEVIDDENGLSVNKAKPAKPINREIRLTGIVTEINERLTRNNRKFITFNTEDFYGSMEFALFKEEMINKFKPFLFKDAMVMITGTYQPRYNDPNAFEFVIKEMQLLSEELFEGMMRGLSIYLDNSELNEQMIQELNHLLMQKKGKCPIRFMVRDAEVSPEKPIVFESQFMTQPTEKLAKGLRKMGLSYALA
ncbi:MAG: DNA polymerase III subunit alpha [Bacteroidia bacterium]